MRGSIKVLYNALHMMKKNVKAYAFLSVTIVISFSALLIYLVYQDSSVYNEYKEIFHTSPYISVVSINEKEDILQNFLEQLNKISDTYYYTCEVQDVKLNQFTSTTDLYCEVSIIPSNVWGYYYNSDNRFEMLNGEKDISLGKNQIIINETFYNSIKKNKEKNGKIYVGIPMRIKKGRTIIQEFEVVGVCKDSDKGMVHKNDDGSIEEYVKAFVSIISFEESELASDYKNVIIYSKNIQKVSELADEMQLANDTTSDIKSKALEEKRNQTKIKTSIILALLFLLSINLYSSFSNAMNERKFEIGVRRAIGASKKSIMLQFLIEGFTVMLINLLLSIMICVFFMCLVKLFKEIIFLKKWVIIVSSYSLEMYLCCCVFFIITFSILFAFMSTRVEIVDYLKNEG